jgi:DNA helicase II / ATP-dependent DNA helicase PcrA
VSAPDRIDADSRVTRVLAGLDPEQRAAAEAVRGPVCILAGAGTGKTRAITHRIANMVHGGTAPAGHILAVTFTARAAGEMRTRLRALGVGGVQARTFHAAALRQLQFFSPRVLGGEMPEIVDRPIRIVANAAARARLRADRTEVRDLAAEIDWAKAVLASPEDYPIRARTAGRETTTSLEKIAEVYEQYEEIKRRGGQLDFSDLLLIMSSALESYADVAEKVRSQYRHFVVDEYQDVSPLQQRMLDAWLGGRDDLCVVGDPNQTIYSFAGATPTHLTGFRGRFPSAEVIRLHRDYRSTPQVVGLANALMKNATGFGVGVELIGQRPDGPQPTFVEFDDEPAEAATIAAACARLVAEGTDAAEIAILFRVNAQSEVYEQALAEAGVPYILRGGERFFDRPEIREARLLLRGAARAASDGDPLVDEVRSVLSSSGWDPERPPPGGAARERWESLAALLALAEETAAAHNGPVLTPPAPTAPPPTGQAPAGQLPTAQAPSAMVPGASSEITPPGQAGPDASGIAAAAGDHAPRPVSLADFVAELDQRAAAQHAPTVQGVTLASLHSAKGLEWDAVFLVGLTDTTLPIQHAKTDAQLAEERRLLYVGITRARERVALSWALARSPGQRRGRKPSRFLDDLRPAGGRPAAKSAGRTQRVTAPAAEDAELFGRLRAWRRKQADAQGVPAYVVFSDATLVGIADSGPTSRAALARVSGVGATKLERYADPVLAVLAGQDPEPVEID